MIIKLFSLKVVFLLLLIQPDFSTGQQSIQSPAEFLGYEPGDHFTPHHRILSYMKHVAETSDRVILHQYGTSYERRELVYLIVTTPDNLDNIEEIRLNNLRLTGLEDGDPGDLQKAIVWLSYNVHGNETSSSEAAMVTLFELADPSNQQTGRWLDQTVVIIDPMLNPDGRDRYVNWYNQMEGTGYNPNHDAREHHEPWPGGRSNHYYFDLNRDWAWQTQIESQYRTGIYHSWMPHIHVDFHEQFYNAPYYFAPAAEPYHKAITDWQREFQTTIGENNMKYFDKKGLLYFTREVFDLFYPSYGDTWPTFNGAIGMTYEQAGHGFAGRGIIIPEGDTLTLKDRLTNHHITGLSTIEVTSQNSRRVISEFRSHFHRANNNPDGEYLSYVIKAGNHPDKIYSLLRYLDDQKIRYGRAGSGRNVNGFHYQTGATGQIHVEPEDIVISSYQPQSQLIRALFEPNPELEDSLTYDITAWEAHYRYGLDGYAVTSRIEPENDIIPEYFRNFHVTGEAGEPYAYILGWGSMDDARFLSDVLQQGVRVRFSRVPFSIDGHHFHKGSLVITRAGNRMENFDRIIMESAQKHARHIHRAETGFVQSGSDFGSANVRLIETPEIALLMGEGTSSLSAGEVWYFFDHQFKYPVTVIDTNRFPNTDLGRFDVLILPDGSYNDVLTDTAMNKIRDWIEQGGNLISIGETNRILAGESGFNISLKLDEINSTQDPEQFLKSYGDREREAIRTANPGSIYRISLDQTHPLAFGYGEEYFSLKLGANAFSYMENGWNVGAAKPDSHLSGFIGHEAKSLLEHTLTFGVQEMGNGKVIYLVDNPLFRGFWENGKLLFVNSIFFTGQ
jgi:hypothetical protein